MPYSQSTVDTARRLTVSVSEAQYHLLREQAERRNLSMSQIFREALELWGAQL